VNAPACSAARGGLDATAAVRLAPGGDPTFDNAWMFAASISLRRASCATAPKRDPRRAAGSKPSRRIASPALGRRDALRWRPEQNRPEPGG